MYAAVKYPMESWPTFVHFDKMDFTLLVKQTDDEDDITIS